MSKQLEIICEYCKCNLWQYYSNIDASTMYNCSCKSSPDLEDFKKPAEPFVRKIIQVSEGSEYTTALCNDGSVWCLYNQDWKKLPDIPQDIVPQEDEDG